MGIPRRYCALSATLVFAGALWVLTSMRSEVGDVLGYLRARVDSLRLSAVGGDGLDIGDGSRDQSRFAYALYATDTTYLCNSMINAARLRRLGVRHDVVIVYPDTWDHLSSDSAEQRGLSRALSSIPNLTIIPVPVISTSRGDPGWHHSLTKFNIFRLTQYQRVIYFDADSLVLRPMDHLFHLPSAPVAMFRAYWLDPYLQSPGVGAGTRQAPLPAPWLGSHLMVVEPSLNTLEMVQKEAARTGAFDMEVANALWSRTAIILPHRRYALLTGEFRRDDHSAYLSETPGVEWEGEVEIKEGYLVHFSDWPIPKPWVMDRQDVLDKAKCNETAAGAMPGGIKGRCRDLEIWKDIYMTYLDERDGICEM